MRLFSIKENVHVLFKHACTVLCLGIGGTNVPLGVVTDNSRGVLVVPDGNLFRKNRPLLIQIPSD